MADTITFTQRQFPYTFPYTFEDADKAYQAAAHEPVLPVEFRYTLPFFFLVDEPSTWHGYYESWQNQSTTLMPEYYPRDLWGLYALGESGGDWMTMQLSTPVFNPNATSVEAPTSITLFTAGRRSVDMRQQI